MVYEELIEVTMRTVRVFVDLPGKGLAEDQGIHEAARDRLEFPQQHKQVGVEHSKLIGALVECLDDHIDVLLKFLNEREGKMI